MVAFLVGTASETLICKSIMARPRKPAAVLEMTGAFRHDPQRRRKSPEAESAAEGVGDAPESFHRPSSSGMNAPMKRLMELVLTGQIAHAGNPVLRWMASNVMAYIDPAGFIKPDKARSIEKIDGIVALIMALGRGMVVSTDVQPVDASSYMMFA